MVSTVVFSTLLIALNAIYVSVQQRKIVNELENREMSVTYDLSYLLNSATRQLRLGSIARPMKLQRPAYFIGLLNEWDRTLSVG